MGKEFSVQGRNKQLEAEVVRIEGLLQKRQDLLSELKTGAGGNVEGFSRYLGALARRSIDGVWLTGITVGGKANDLVIKGRALSSDLVPAYVSSLGKDPALAGRSVSSLLLSARSDPPAKGGPAGYVEFTLNIPLAGEAAPAAAQKGAS
jgi:Tfp pilus assembly protein PilN